jgi:hypothetical protein
MRGFWYGLSISVAFVLGSVAAPLLVPETVAQPTPAGATRWEHKCLDRVAFRRLENLANDLGQQGWRLSQYVLSNEVVCFERRRP